MWARASPLVLPRHRTSAAPDPNCNPLLMYVPSVGRESSPAPAAAASFHLSAILAASLKIRTNIGRVNFPVCVFWLEGW
jgi:hypothetical protein